MESDIAQRFEQPAPPGHATPPANRAEPAGADRYMLEGPQARTGEFASLLSIIRDFLRGFRVLHFVGPCVTVFGSARVAPTDRFYGLAQQMGYELPHASAGGGSDGNFTGAMGIPTLDGLGVRGLPCQPYRGRTSL